MFKKKEFNKIICVILMFFSISNLFIERALAFPKKEVYVGDNVYTASMEIGNNFNFDGVFDSFSWYFNVDKNTRATEGNINLKYKATDIISTETGSYLTLSINSTKFKSIKINEGNVMENVSISIPVDLLKEGSNELKIEGYLRVTDTACTDDYNTANWLCLFGDSTVDLKLKNLVVEDFISYLPYPFVNSGGFSETTILLPNDYSQDELSTAMNLEVYLGSKGGKAEICKMDDMGDLTNSNLIFVSLEKNIPEVFKEILGDYNRDKLQENAFIAMGSNPFSTRKENKALAIISSNGEELKNSWRFLMKEELVSQINKSSTYINSNMDLENKLEKQEGNLSFSSLGYNEMKFTGLFRSEASLGYLLPQNKRMSPGDKISIKMRYSKNIDFNRSLFTVYINGTPIGSKKLKEDFAEEDEFSILIPEDVTKASYADIKFAFDLYVSGVNCEIRQQEDPWAVILGDSYITINGKEINEYYFDTYPSPFINDWEENEIVLLLPNSLTSLELSQLGKVIAFMGESVKYNTGKIEVVFQGDSLDKYKDKNIILYGTPKNNIVIKELNNNLWFKYNEDFDGFLSNEKLYLMEDFSKNMVTFQLDNSPYNKEKSILILTSPKEELLVKSLIYLNNSEYFSKLTGDGTVIDEYGNVKNYKYKLQEEEPIYKHIEKLQVGSKLLLVLMILILIFIAIAFGLYYYKNRRKKGI